MSRFGTGWSRRVSEQIRAAFGLARRPNVLWVCADDFACSACGCYGGPPGRTPHLDRLADQGILFERAYCNCPLSTPSRQSFWTGRYPRTIGVTLSPTPLPKSEVTLPALLRRAGYETAAFGKTHYYAPRKHEFDACADHVEHGRWLWEKGSDPIPTGVEVLGPWRPFRDPASVWLNAACLPFAADADMDDTYYTEETVRFLEADHRRPFFLYCSLAATHSPFRFPVEFRGRYDPAAFSVPGVTPQEFDRLPPVFRSLTDADKRGILAAYHTAAAYLDRNVGRVLEALGRSRAARDTLVLFTSDHGYLLGQHGRFEKHCCYEPAVRAALLLRLPGPPGPPRRIGALVELIDLVPTILDLCGLDSPANVQGKSLLALLHGKTHAHRDHVVTEYADNAEAMIRTERWKLIYSSGRRRRRDGYALDGPAGGRSVRLYDLARDPDEHIDLAHEPGQEERVNDLLARLADHVARTARRPEATPKTGDALAILDQGLSPPELEDQ